MNKVLQRVVDWLLVLCLQLISASEQCCKYCFGEYIVKSPERNLSEILGKIPAHKLGMAKIGILENWKNIGNIGRNRIYLQYCF